MSHYYSRLRGLKGEVTRTGTKTSGMLAEAFGWDVGGRVRMQYNAKLDTDVVSLYVTTGNNSTSKLVASYIVKDGKLVHLQTEMPEILL
jgi:hypothetical protein